MSTLPATHLLRRFMMFALTIVFLMTMARAAFSLWQFARLDTGSLIPLFIEGLRHDLALAGLICLVPVVFGSLLSMLSGTRWLARLIILVFLVGGLILVLLSEILTPWFIQAQSIRPDLDALNAVEDIRGTLSSVWSTHMIPLLGSLLLAMLIIFAFIRRLELSRFLRYRLNVPSALMLAVFGGLLCLVAIWSTPDLRQSPLAYVEASVPSGDNATDVSMSREITLNTTGKILFDIARPVLETIQEKVAGLLPVTPD
ncbi:MAG: hypothetical protein V3U76_08585 [Granulosicoccus sp.]